MITWQRLHPGDKVQLIAPASRLMDPEKDLAGSLELLRQWRLEPQYSARIDAPNSRYPMLSNSDDQRLADLVEAIANPEIKAVFVARGGYGCIRLLAGLKRLQPPEPVKPLIGFSDITVLLVYLSQCWGWPSLHGPSPTQAARKAVDEPHLAQLRQILFGEVTQVKLEGLEPLNQAAKQRQRIDASMVGGNLTLINRLLGTPYELQTKAKILFLEDIAEPFRKLDGMLWQWQQAGLFSELKRPAAILFGEFVQSDGNERLACDNAIAEFAQAADRYQIPVLNCHLFGHGRTNQPIPVNTPARLTTGPSPAIGVSTGVLEKLQQA